MIGRIKTMPRCEGCGFTVEAGVRYCEGCKDKPQFAPKAMIETAPQPEPPYLTQGNFRRLPSAIVEPDDDGVGEVGG